MEHPVSISISLPADLLVGLGHAANAAGRTPGDHLRALLRQGLGHRLARRLPATPDGNAECITTRVLQALRDSQAQPVQPPDPPGDGPADGRASSGADPLVALIRRVCRADGDAGRPDAPKRSAALPAADDGCAVLAAARALVDGASAAADIVAGPDRAAGRPEADDAEPADTVLPQGPGGSTVAGLILGSAGWLDAQRRLRRDGLVLRLSNQGKGLDLHSWPADRPLMPVAAVGLSLDGLCLHFRAPFPGGDGLSLGLRRLIAGERGPDRVA